MYVSASLESGLWSSCVPYFIIQNFTLCLSQVSFSAPHSSTTTRSLYPSESSRYFKFTLTWCHVGLSYVWWSCGAFL
jgi:hypothetical protein